MSRFGDASPNLAPGLPAPSFEQVVGIPSAGQSSTPPPQARQTQIATDGSDRRTPFGGERRTRIGCERMTMGDRLSGFACSYPTHTTQGQSHFTQVQQARMSQVAKAANLFISPEAATQIRRASDGSDTEMRFGAGIEDNPDLAKLLHRETFFLTVVIPQHRTWGAAAFDWFTRSLKPDIYGTLLLVVILHAGLAAYCAAEADDDGSEGICAGGPVDEDLQPLQYLSFGGDLGPPILNSLAVLMLSFYANTCLGLYREAYTTCQALRTSIVDLMTIVVGTIHPYDDDGVESHHRVRMEFWRCASLLLHLCSYMSSDF